MAAVLFRHSEDRGLYVLRSGAIIVSLLRELKRLKAHTRHRHLIFLAGDFLPVRPLGQNLQEFVLEGEEVLTLGIKLA